MFKISALNVAKTWSNWKITFLCISNFRIYDELSLLHSPLNIG